MRLLFAYFHSAKLDQQPLELLCQPKKTSEKVFVTLSNSSKASLNSALSSSSRLLVILSSDQLVPPILTATGQLGQHLRLRFAQHWPSPTGRPPPGDLSVPSKATRDRLASSQPTLPPDYVTQVKRTPCRFHCLNSIFSFESGEQEKAESSVFRAHLRSFTSCWDNFLVQVLQRNYFVGCEYV